MNMAEVFVLGIVEGITEFLPVSSTGHLIIAGKFLGLPDGEFSKSFNIVIQLGAILSVVVLYFRKLFLDIPMMKKLIAAFIPTAVIGLLFYKAIKQYLLGNVLVVVVSLFIGGILILVLEKIFVGRKDEGKDISQMSYFEAVLIGLAQSVAMIPGVSRSAATILGGLGLGFKREAIVEFSFLLAVPTMAAAAALDLLKSFSLFTRADALALSVGFFASFAVALASIRFLLGYVRKYSFSAFGWYRIAAAAALFVFLGM